MSRLQYPDKTVVDVRIDGIDECAKEDGHRDLSQPVQGQTSQRLSHSSSSDTSIPLFALYLQRAEKLDGETFKLLKGDSDQVLVFSGLFSATLAALMVTLFPTFSDFENLLSSNSNSNSNSTSDSGLTGSQVLDGISFTLSLWSWSLLTSILCATLALSLQKWAQPNSMIISPCYSLPEQARLHALFAAGFKTFKSLHLIKVIHGLIHISLGLFLYGLYQYWAGFGAISVILGTYLGIFGLVFIFFTVFPVLRPGFPCSTPFSLIFAIAYACVVRGTSRLLYLATSPIRIRNGRAVHRPKNYYRGWNLWKLAEDKAQELAPRFDSDILKQTLDMLRSDDDLEQFFDTIPGFCASKIIHNPRQSLDVLGQQRLAEALIGFWNRTLSSNLVPESVKGRRLLVCMEAIEAADLAIAAPGTLRDLSFKYLGRIARSVEVGHSLGNLRDGNVASLARGIIAAIISNADRNDRWSMLAIDELGISRNVLRDYLAHGDSVLLANLMHITRHFFDGLLQPHPDLTREALSILPSISKFDIRDTLPELQHDFCALWNDVIRQVQGSGAENNFFIEILHDIWGLYVALHGTTANKYDPLRPPTSYPLCEDDSHRNLTTHVQ
ncbi:hypothetical protein BGY98DRAFT_968724 [Russula aff. rugulosa BPL654]|nr:hypothetical protein BGY98DRAFT_968724 [Russula aff. rugulosa BPL654]